MLQVATLREIWKPMIRNWAFLVVATILWNTLTSGGVLGLFPPSIPKVNKNTAFQRSLSAYPSLMIAYFLFQMKSHSSIHNGVRLLHSRNEN